MDPLKELTQLTFIVHVTPMLLCTHSLRWVVLHIPPLDTTRQSLIASGGIPPQDTTRQVTDV